MIKKSITFVILCSFALITVTSCSTDDELENQTDKIELATGGELDDSDDSDEEGD